MIGALIAFCMVGCNRVPSNKRLLPNLTVKLPQIPQTDSEAADKSAEIEFDLPPLCARACKHWSKVRFPTPKGVRLATSNQAELLEIFDRKRAVNRAECEQECITSENLSRARCILRAKNKTQIKRCKKVR